MLQISFIKVKGNTNFKKEKEKLPLEKTSHPKVPHSSNTNAAPGDGQARN